MNKLITVVGASGVGKTTFVHALAGTGYFETALEDHAERPFQSLLKSDERYALANQMDYLLLRAEQEKQLRTGSKIGLMDGGLDLDFHGFTRLFHSRGLLTDSERDLCERLYHFIRAALPQPDLILHLKADEQIVADRLSHRNRINIARVEDTTLFNAFVREWLETLPPERLLEFDVSTEDTGYAESLRSVLDFIAAWAYT